MYNSPDILSDKKFRQFPTNKIQILKSFLGTPESPQFKFVLISKKSDFLYK